MSEMTHQIIGKLIDNAKFEEARAVIATARDLGYNHPDLKRFELYMRQIDGLAGMCDKIDYEEEH